jgi:uncharacterized protein YjiS (DUF1127 family)
MHFPHQWSVNALADPTEVSFDLATIKLKGWGRWISFITSIVAKLWVRMAREREIRRMLRAAWATIDDRTLRDIGVSRLEMAYVGIRPCRAADMSVAQLCDRKMGRVSVVPGPHSQAAYPGCPVH